MKKIILTVFFLISIFSISPALAAPSSVELEAMRQLGAAAGAEGANLAGGEVDPRIIVARVIRAALGILGIIFLVLTLYAGFLWMTAGGEEEKITKAKKLLYDGVIGLAIIFAAYSITWFVFRVALGLNPYEVSPGAGVEVNDYSISF